MRDRRKYRQLLAAIALLFVGLIGVLGMGASVQRYRPSDLLRLLSSGACFGAAIVVMVNLARRPRGE